MAQYQSFPGIPGDSQTLEKLKALRLPALGGKRFLDVGCNEGFFCGYALFDGARRVVGIDQSAVFIARARKRFPGAEFLQQGWDRLPDGPFDVILLASALHYAADQPALIDALTKNLAQDGILVLELGIDSSKSAEWVKVERGIDERLFPSMSMLREVLRDYAWKWMGPSVAQAGDPVARHVIHISRPRPMAYLLMQPPAYGKTSIAKRVFGPAGIPVVSGDEMIAQVAQGKRDAPAQLRALLSEDYSPFRIDETIRNVFAQGMGRALIEVWKEAAGGGDFALDAYVPGDNHGEVEAALRAVGYLPVTLQWERVAAGLPSAADIAARADQFFGQLAEGAESASREGREAREGPTSVQGFVDDVSMSGGTVTIRGWAVGWGGVEVDTLEVRIGRTRRRVDAFAREYRPDVRKHLALDHGMYGYVVELSAPSGIRSLTQLAGNLEVRIGVDGGQPGVSLPLAGPLARKLGVPA